MQGPVGEVRPSVSQKYPSVQSVHSPLVSSPVWLLYVATGHFGWLLPVLDAEIVVTGLYIAWIDACELHGIRKI